MLEKAHIALKGLLGEIWILNLILFRGVKEIRAEEQASIVLENTSYMIMNKVLVEMNFKGKSDEISNGDGEYIIGNWRKGNPYHKVTRNLTELCCNVLWKWNLKEMKLICN